jgi:hypothetical protein
MQNLDHPACVIIPLAKYVSEKSCNTNPNPSRQTSQLIIYLTYLESEPVRQPSRSRPIRIDKVVFLALLLAVAGSVA